jgi:lipopolysaccharide/colanic/teichoic acid biosynthesis glycosyltransferase
VRAVNNKTDFGGGHITAAVGPQSSVSTSSGAAAGTFRFGPISKRVFDIVVGISGLILFSPIFLLSSLAIRLVSREPIFCRKIRHGYGNQTFRLLTFRCATTQTTDIAGVTSIGFILRSSGIDGLPRLIDVLCGKMSIVGPPPYETLPGAMFDEQLSRFSQQWNVKPGLTGWAQVNGCRDASNSFTAMRRRIEYDLYYVENWSLLFDLQIILMTLCSKKTYARADWTIDR